MPHNIQNKYLIIKHLPKIFSAITISPLNGANGVKIYQQKGLDGLKGKYFYTKIEHYVML